MVGAQDLEQHFLKLGWDEGTKTFREIEHDRSYGREFRVEPYGDPSIIVLKQGERLTDEALLTSLKEEGLELRSSLGYILGNWRHLNNFSISCAAVQFYIIPDQKPILEPIPNSVAATQWSIFTD